MKKRTILLHVLIIISQIALCQNVGIGTSTPTRAKLEVHGAVGGTSAIFGGESTGLSLQRNFPGIGFNQYFNGYSRYINQGFAAVQYFNPGTGVMSIDMFPNGQAGEIAVPSIPIMTMASNGRLAIGSRNISASTLQVARGNGPDGTAAFFGTQHHSFFNYGQQENTYIRAGLGGGTVFINDIPGGRTVFTGFIGINTATPVYPLEIRQKNYKGLVMVDEATFDSWALRAYDQGLDFRYNEKTISFILGTNGHYVEVSDRRKKKDVEELPSMLSKIKQLRPVSYHLIQNDSSQARDLGFIAQEVKELFPELVAVRSEPGNDPNVIKDLHTLDYNKFGVLAIKAIQEQQQIIEKLQQEIITLKATVQTLKAQKN